MQTPQIAQYCPLTPAERGVVSAWATGNLTDKEAARALNKGHRTVRSQRESIANRAGAPDFKSGSAHLLIHLIQIGWLRFVLLTALAVSPAIERATHTDIPNERARRTRREQMLSAKVTQLHTGGAA
jgi:DNA-binding NarL/FixJ family response regulator